MNKQKYYSTGNIQNNLEYTGKIFLAGVSVKNNSEMILKILCKNGQMGRTKHKNILWVCSI